MGGTGGGQGVRHPTFPATTGYLVSAFRVENLRLTLHITGMLQQFGSFTASELYCPKCGSSQPVREKLLLVLPSGELHEFLCARCATSVGKRTVSGPSVAAPVRARPPKRPPPRRLLR